MDQIDEDCESGGTDKSVHFPEVIKQDAKKIKQVKFDVVELPKEVKRQPSFKIKDITERHVSHKPFKLNPQFNENVD